MSFHDVCTLAQVNSLKKPIEDICLRELNLERMRMGKNRSILNAFGAHSFL